ncbi:MAG: hypothetical protein SPL64_06770 [Bacteroidaceae bacterium]|nr:hypothetical protein [Bacteroidaceae bacterium]
MSNLDNMLDNQQKQSVPSGKTWLKKLSIAYVWIGCIALFFGFVLFTYGLSDPRDKGDAITAGIIGAFFGGLFTIFMGCIGEAIDDIRNNTKK